MFNLICWKTSSKKPAAQSARPQVELLEDRWVPAMVDLTTHGAIGSVVAADGSTAIVRQFDAQPTGSGVINSFVRLQSTKNAVQQGYNSDHRSVQFDENTSPQFTRALSINDVPVVNIGGVKYREFLLDINQKASQPMLSLDELRIYIGGSGNLSGYNATDHTLAGMSPTFDMGDNWIKLNSRLNQGSGKGDMLVYIPDSAFTGGSFVYLYSKFGVNFTPNAGFEEWAAGSQPLTCNTGTINGTITNLSTGTPLVNVLVFLDANHNGVVDNNETFTYTDANGFYQFSFLATGLGTYSVYDVTVLVTNDNTDTTILTAMDVSLDHCEQTANANFVIDLFTPPPPPPPNS